MTEKIIHVSGKRKRSVARATIRKGKGQIRINKLLLKNYQPNLAKQRIMEPLIIADNIVNSVKIDVNVKGGGWQGQTEAARLAIARALVKFTENKELEKNFLEYDRNLLVADVRRKEPNKPNDSKARKKRQKSYR